MIAATAFHACSEAATYVSLHNKLDECWQAEASYMLLLLRLVLVAPFM